MLYQPQTENVILEYDIQHSSRYTKYLGTSLMKVCKISLDKIMTFFEGH